MNPYEIVTCLHVVSTAFVMSNMRKKAEGQCFLLEMGKDSVLHRSLILVWKSALAPMSPRSEQPLKCFSLPRAMNSWSSYWYPITPQEISEIIQIALEPNVNVVTHTHKHRHTHGPCGRKKQLSAEPIIIFVILFAISRTHANVSTVPATHLSE